MADTTYQPKVYRKQGGDEMVIANGGALTAEAGATVDLSAATVNLPDSTVVLADVADGILQGAKVANTANVNVIGGLPVLHRITIADGASADLDVTLTHKTRVIDVWLVKTSAAGHATEDTITVKNGATAITDAIAVGAADKAIKRAATIDDAAWDIAAAGTLRISKVKGAGGGNNVACEVFVLGLRVA